MATLNLLAVQCKKAEPVDLRDPVYKYVAHTYSAQQAKDASDDLAAVQEERNEISVSSAYVRPSCTHRCSQGPNLKTPCVQNRYTSLLSITSCIITARSASSPYYRYYCGLSMMETRFPISKERDHVHIGFKWFDAFRPTRALEQSSIHYEKASVLFNLGAVYTQQALGFDRTTDSGIKDAAKKYQASPFRICLCCKPRLRK
jgi:programmed cell death 6-interacting protein